MNKKQYLNELHNYLFEKDVSKKDIESVISDYAELYDEAIALGFNDEEVILKLGKPKQIFEGIKDTLKFGGASNRNKIVGIMPFIATILFFAVGFGLDGWDYGWTFYLIIPVTAILVNVRGREKFIAITPFIAMITFFLLGMFLDLWHPGWMIFLIVPITAILLKTKAKDKVVALLPFVLVITYVLIGTYVNFEFYYYGWAMFALIPMLAILINEKGIKAMFMFVSILIAVVLHLTIYFTTKDYNYAWLPYLLPIGVGILLGYITVLTDTNINIKAKKWVLLSFLFIAATYFVVSLLVDNIWSWSWIILLLIPMIGIYDNIKFEHPVAYMPFITLIAFMLLGTFGNLWDMAWMVFLAIPITAILTEQDNKHKVIEKDNVDHESSDR